MTSELDVITNIHISFVNQVLSGFRTIKTHL